MSIAQLFNRVPQSPQEFLQWLDEWGFANQSDHAAINAAILAQKNTQISSFVIYPIAALDVFLINHQAMHDQESAATGTGGQDFSAPNFQDHASLREWAFEHGTEHRQFRQALGLG